MRADNDNCPTALYRHICLEGKLLYVGISNTPTARTEQHAKKATWFRNIANIQISWYPSRQEALEAEATAIRDEKPRHNLIKPLPRMTVLEKFRTSAPRSWDRYIDPKVYEWPGLSVYEIKRKYGFGPTEIEKMVCNGEFPSPIKTTPSGDIKRCRWSRREVQAWECALNSLCFSNDNFLGQPSTKYQGSA